MGSTLNEVRALTPPFGRVATACVSWILTVAPPRLGSLLRLVPTVQH